ncbi:MAG: hypothetical protein KF789_00845 [Bdellovibrionaceae bacterium]|nr:hypothetical protein [Pseudobdellovibrionaceae bacterium]
MTALLIFLALLSAGVAKAETGPRPAAEGAPAVTRSVRVTASSLRVRTAGGDHVCSIKRGTVVTAVARDGGDDRVKVKLNSKGCPSEGYVYANYVMPEGSGWKDIVTKVDVDQLALRGEPSPEGSFKCGLKKNTEVAIVNEAPDRAASGSWVQVSLTNPVPGCPTLGYVNSSYLKPSEVFNDLPIINETDEEEVAGGNANTEAGTACLTGDCNKEQTTVDQNIKDIKVALEAGTKNAFVEELRRMIKNPKAKPKGFSSNRGLIQIPLQGNKGNIGPCGSFHYNPDSPKGVDAYANPTTACAFTAFLQDWKKSECPSGAGCRLSWGDISHKKKARFNGHKSHTDGHCIDIRPMKKGSFSGAPLTYEDPSYDRATMKRMIAKMKDFGADTMYFNDKQCGTKYASGHHNHIHVCFKPGPKTREACDNLVIDPNVCPELM